MDFLIKCDVFSRLAQVTRQFDKTTDFDTKKMISCVRLEYRKGHYYAIATNQQIAAIQYLGRTDQPDGEAHVVNDDVLIKQCIQETLYDSSLFVQVIPEFALANIVTTTGWAYKGQGCIYPENGPLDTWRNWFPDKNPTKSNGIMYWNIDHIESLARSSPSGHLYFPKFIDVEKPVVIRDRFDDNWCGLYIPRPHLSDGSITKEAEKPAWI